MSNVPSFPGCSTCGDSSTPIQTVPVPYCGQQESTDACASQKGKFHDRLTDDFIVPKVGKEAKIHVCDGHLWAKHQWIGIANGADKVAVYPIIAIGNKTITILNGCRTGEEIFGNAEVGKEFKEGTIVYPVPPQGCDSNFCERVSETIRTCGVDAVLELLSLNEDICFTNVPEIEETERGHIFVGTMPDPCNCPEEYGVGEGTGSISQDPDNLWRSCLRKLTKIFTNLGGRTFCFASMPEYNSENDPDGLGRAVVLDQKGCMAKGESVSSCGEEYALGEDIGAEAIIVCKDGGRKILVPECDSMIVGCCDEDDLNPKWYVRKKGLTLHLLETPIDVYSVAMIAIGSVTVPAAVNIPAGSTVVIKEFNEELIPKHCKQAYALVDTYIVHSDGGTNLNLDILYNNNGYRKIYNDSADRNLTVFQDIVPLQAGVNINKLRVDYVKLAGTSTWRVLTRILGFYA